MLLCTRQLTEFSCWIQDCAKILKKQDSKCQEKCKVDKKYKSCLETEKEIDAKCDRCNFGKTEIAKLKKHEGIHDALFYWKLMPCKQFW